MDNLTEMFPAAIFVPPAYRHPYDHSGLGYGSAPEEVLPGCKSSSFRHDKHNGNVVVNKFDAECPPTRVLDDDPEELTLFSREAGRVEMHMNVTWQQKRLTTTDKGMHGLKCTQS